MEYHSNALESPSQISTLEHRYNLLRFLEPHDLARVQESSRALCFVAGQEALWSRLCTYRKQYPRINKLDQTAFQQWNRFATNLEGRVYVVSSSRIFFDMSLTCIVLVCKTQIHSNTNTRTQTLEHKHSNTGT